ncbi:hypothetical protein JXA48_05105 [Candidatus Woesearchaeota archaeon]|nr:hypothetical protein [Candidatus Woesearchaeota archaeon]
MVLDSKTTRKIITYVAIKPRSIQEIANHIKKNWRTADSYVDKISKEDGSIQTRIFREGTRGALKIVYHQSVKQITSNTFQEQLLKQIELAKEKNDLSPFDIYQYVDKDKRRAFLEEQEEYKITLKQDLVSLLRSAKKQVLIFSGDFSWSQAKQGKTRLRKIFEELADKGISIKVIASVEINNIKQIEETLAINDYSKREAIEIRHRNQPFRAFVIDNNIVRFKETRANHFADKTNKKNLFIFYDILDDLWLDWIIKVFWHLFSGSVDAKKRIEDLRTIERIQ